MYFLSIECNKSDRKLSSCWCVCRVHVAELLLWVLCLSACIQGHWIGPMGLMHGHDVISVTVVGSM